MSSHFDEYRKKLQAENLTSFEDLENLVKPLIRNAIKIEVSKAVKEPQNAASLSHFGGQPYFETGEEWPKSKNGRPLSFIFQIYNNETVNFPNNIQLIQFFYDWEEFPWDTENEGWLVKIQEKLNPENAIKIEKPKSLETSKFCKISFKAVQSLPDWEGLDVYSEKASNLSCILNEDEPWGSYQKMVKKLIGEQNYQSQIGGYPNWVQGESTPKNTKNEPMKLLFQIDSEENANLMWGDVGLIYFFYDENEKRVEFTLQCH